MPTLGQRLSELGSAILALQKKTRSVAQKRKLHDQLDEILEIAGKLVDANVDDATEEYKEATRGLQAAARATRQAMDDLKQVAATIDKIAEAVDLIAKVAALAAG